MVVVVLAGGVGPAGGAGDWSDVLALDVVVVEAVLVLVVVVVVVMRTEQSSGLGPRQPAAATHWALQSWPRSEITRERMIKNPHKQGKKNRGQGGGEGGRHRNNETVN